MQGRGRVGHPIHNCCLRLFFLEKDCVYLDAERLYDHIKREMFQTARSNSASATGTSQTNTEKTLCS